MLNLLIFNDIIYIISTEEIYILENSNQFLLSNFYKILNQYSNNLNLVKINFNLCFLDKCNSHLFLNVFFSKNFNKYDFLFNKTYCCYYFLIK